MPNDPASQFPLPAQTAPAVGGPTGPAATSAPREIPLTDEVAPDLTTPPLAPEVSPQTVAPTDVGDSSEVKPMPTPVPTPATFTPSRPFPLLTILLLLISVTGIAAAYFFYQQNLTLSQQLTEIERTLEQQRIRENQTTPTPTPSPTLEITPTGTISATITPTTTPTTTPGSVFSGIGSVLAAATAKYPAARFLMVTATGVESPSTMIVKYWFRQTETDKRYLYVLKEAGRDLALVDQQVYVTPDNNIPSLDQLAAAGQLGIDLPEALGVAGTACPSNLSCNFTPVSSQYIKAGATLWQISYKPTDGSKPFVIQIDSTTKKILYKNQ